MHTRQERRVGGRFEYIRHGIVFQIYRMTKKAIEIHKSLNCLLLSPDKLRKKNGKFDNREIVERKKKTNF